MDDVKVAAHRPGTRLPFWRNAAFNSRAFLFFLSVLFFMESARTNPRRGDSRAQSPLESSSDELATGSDHDEAERRRTSFTIQKNLTPQRPNHQKRRYRESESSDELAVDAGEYWRSSRSHQRSPSPINRPADTNSHAEHSHDESDRLSDRIGNRDNEHTGARDDGSDRSPTPVPPAALPPPKPEHLDYREKFVLRGHIRGISAVQFSPDCSMIASAGMLLSHVSTIAPIHSDWVFRRRRRRGQGLGYFDWSTGLHL